MNPNRSVDGQPASAPSGAARVVAIDGPAGSGKSTVARTVAGRLGMAHLDTGAMYRGVAFAALEAGIDLGDGDALDALAERVDMAFDGSRLLVDGADATEAIRGQAVSTAVSPVATNAGVREVMVQRQREWAADHDGGVIEGRDIGTAVFPDAPVKVFLTATPEERARRRSDETDDVDLETLAAQIAERDERDANRAVNPMRPADDGVVIDTTDLNLDQVVDAVIALVPWVGEDRKSRPRQSLNRPPIPSLRARRQACPGRLCGLPNPSSMPLRWALAPASVTGPSPARHAPWPRSPTAARSWARNGCPARGPTSWHRRTGRVSISS